MKDEESDRQEMKKEENNRKEMIKEMDKMKNEESNRRRGKTIRRKKIIGRR